MNEPYKHPLSSFEMNGYLWRVVKVRKDDPMLVDRTGVRTVGTTDPTTFTIYLSRDLYGDFADTVLLHELAHATMISYGMLDYLSQHIPNNRDRIAVEEWACNLIADHGRKIFSTASKILGDEAWRHVPEELGKFIA